MKIARFAITASKYADNYQLVFVLVSCLPCSSVCFALIQGSFSCMYLLPFSPGRSLQTMHPGIYILPQAFNFSFCSLNFFNQGFICFIHYLIMKLRNFAIRQFMHQHKSAVYKISKDGHQFTINRILETFPGKFTVLWFRVAIVVK